LLQFPNEELVTGKMPDERGNAITIPILKRGDKKVQK
jgi:hypothetical protein